MKTAAIISEYNPFHNGHKYQIEETRRRTGADFIAVVMSGDFVQRGAPAIYSKFLRTRSALLSGADLVVEMPVFGSLSAAQDFARCGISLFHHMGIIDVLSFGSEAGEIKKLQELADQVHLSREVCCRLFKKMTGKTITGYLEEYRVNQSLPLVQSCQYSMIQIADMTGFSNASRFARAFRRQFGCNPGEYNSLKLQKC